MLLFCAGMVKSGSGWHFNVVNALNVMAGGADTREVRERFDLWEAMPTENCNLDGVLDRGLLERLTAGELGEETFAVKSHRLPVPSFEQFLDAGTVRAAYSLRDLVDVALSALRHGQRTRDEDTIGGFRQIRTVDDAVQMAAAQQRVAMRWIELAAARDDVTLLPYADLVEHPVTVARRLATFFGLDLAPEVVDAVAGEWLPGEMDSSQRWFVHYDQGRPGGHRASYDVETLRRLDEALQADSDEMLTACRDVVGQRL